MNYPTFIGFQNCIKIPTNRYIAGSSKCSTKPLSLLLTKLLKAIKESFQKYCSIAYSKSGVTHMWILKKCKELLED
jgi:hypothetical protein